MPHWSSELLVKSQPHYNLTKMAEGERVASGLGAIVPAVPISAMLGPYIKHPPTKFLDTIVSIAVEGCIPEVMRFAEITLLNDR